LTSEPSITGLLNQFLESPDALGKVLLGQGLVRIVQDEAKKLEICLGTAGPHDARQGRKAELLRTQLAAGSVDDQILIGSSCAYEEGLEDAKALHG
jgi:hypothetical protein